MNEEMKTEISSLLKNIVREELSSQKQELESYMLDNISSSKDELEKSFKLQADANSKKLKERMKSEGRIKLKSKGHVEQFEFNADIIDRVDELKDNLTDKTVAEVEEVLTDVIGKLRHRNK